MNRHHNQSRLSLEETTARASASALERVLLRPCERHDAPSTVPCWCVRGDLAGDEHPAVCGSRLRAAGFVPPARPADDRPAPSSSATKSTITSRRTR